MNGLKISELAERAGVNVSTVRERAAEMIDVNISDIDARIAQLETLAAGLRRMREQLSSGGEVCDADLGCCEPSPVNKGANP